MRAASRKGWVGWAASAVVVVGLALLLVAPTASVASAAARPLGTVPSVSGTSVKLTNPQATWNGQPLSTAATEGSAFKIATGATVLVKFTYGIPLGGPNVTTARITALYFGAAISTDQVGAHNELVAGSGSGSAVMNWTLGTFTYLLAGVYELRASLVAGNGSTVWSENFYIDATAPDHIESGLTLFLAILGIVELWSIATVGRAVRRRPPTAPSAPPTQWQPSGPAPTTPPAAGGTPPAPEGAPPAPPAEEESP